MQIFLLHCTFVDDDGLIREGARVSLELIDKIKHDFEQQLGSAKSYEEFVAIKNSFLAKKGIIAGLLEQMRALPAQERPEFGKAVNLLKDFCQQQIDQQENQLTIQFFTQKNRQERSLDITARPTSEKFAGNLHVSSKFLRRIEEIFISMGFRIFDGPEVETDFYNFGALNIPQDHPARDMYDTLWLDKPGHLLRTHTSTIQIRAIKEFGVPLAGIAPGRVFRHEATDATHEIVFSQCEGLLIDKNISLSHLIGVAKVFLAEFFATKNLDIRIRPGFFPFVEPGLEIDVRCVFCKHGCSICKQTTWIEVFPGGMVHPNVLKAAGVDASEYSGFAFGFGMDRLAMLMHAIDDVRLFRSGDVRFLKQF